MRIVWSPTSQWKIDKIVDYISKDNVDAALALVEEFEKHVQHLKKHPRSGQMVPALNDEMVRQLVVQTNYLIIYEINQNQIDILTIRHARQDENESDIKPE
ncbi:type II toxin-antitoxin system RelE/ParE family toxin [Fodinibius salsisoli]|uniref:Type II toxin-antitoxin system RelE/ParE family toxin n=1 Tax=Fodinibius salsisoli TaxID=2820877 RepID=A0ABT3PMU2_9BACT|nr:type II toxin-antitoxin system RelE/ParE family toxin [Fodinibius salsisoli]MCW9707269.1 type II toxin-antitoxin system RelE/ParE family toxin [Fodinibius salsisoli]